MGVGVAGCPAARALGGAQEAGGAHPHPTPSPAQHTRPPCITSAAPPLHCPLLRYAQEEEQATYYDSIKAELSERAARTKAALDALDPATRLAMEVRAAGVLGWAAWRPGSLAACVGWAPGQAGSTVLQRGGHTSGEQERGSRFKRGLPLRHPAAPPVRAQPNRAGPPPGRLRAPALQRRAV